MQKGKLLGVIVCLSMLLAGCTTKAPTSEESKQSEGSSEVSSSPISSSKPSSSSSSKASSSSAAPVDDMEVVSHEKGEGEVTETVKKRKNAEYYEITWQATDSAATATGFSDGKFSKLGDNVEYKVWSPVSMVARLYANATYNKDSIKGVSNTEDHTVWYDWRSKSAATPFKVKVEVNGEEYDQSAQTLVVKGKEVSLQDLNFPDLDYAGTNDEVLEMPWLDVQLNKGVNTIKLTRTAGYGHSYKTFSLRSDNDLHNWSIDDLKANRSEGDWGDKEWDDIGVKAFKVSVKQGTFSVSYTSPKAQKASLNVYIACKFSNSNQTPFWKKSGADKTEVTLNGVKIENGIEPDWTGCVESSLNDNGKLSYPIWFKIADVKLVEGENTFVFKYIDGGYSYHICAASLGKAKPAIVGEVEEEDGYRVNFKTEHCKVFVYEDQDYTVEPVEATSALTRDENGVICKYSPADPTNNVEEVKPQMNFKVVCDEGYEVDTTCFTLSGEEGKEWNNLKDISDGVFRITTIKDSIDVTIKAATAGTLKAGYTAEFVTEHCTVKVYTEKGFKAEDTATPYMSRNKTKADDGTYPYCKGENAQLSFEVIPEEGYEFVSGLDVGAEAESDVIEFIAPSGYNKI